MTTLRTIKEAAEALRCSTRTVYRLIEEHRLKVTKVRGGSFVTEAELERYLRGAERGNGGRHAA